MEAIQSALAQTAGRRRWQRALNGMCFGGFIGATVWLLALGAYKLFPIPDSAVQVAIAVALVLTLAASCAVGSASPPSPNRRYKVDHQQHCRKRAQHRARNVPIRRQ